MTSDEHETPAADLPGQDLPDAVAEALYELAMRESEEFSLMYSPGACTSPEGERLLSTSMDTACGSISFFEDGRGGQWLTWQVYADSRSGARRVRPSEDVDHLARFCLVILSRPRTGSSGARVCH